MVRWMAPILSFTAQEVWQYLPGERGEYVFLETWYQELVPLPDSGQLDAAQWQQIMAVRVAVGKQVEKLREESVLGSSLEAEVTLYCDQGLLATMSRLGDELRFVMISSTAELKALDAKSAAAVSTDIDGLLLEVPASTHEKCVRCWHHREDVGSHQDHPELCGRCIENVDGDGESRHFA